MTTNIQHLDLWRAFSAARPRNQELLETLYLPNESSISTSASIPVLYQFQELVTWFSSSNPSLSIPSASESFTLQPLTHLCQRGFGISYTIVNDLDDSLRTQIWSSEQVSASFKWCIKGYKTEMRSTRGHVWAWGGCAKQGGQDVFCLRKKNREIDLENRAGGVGTRWFMCRYT